MILYSCMLQKKMGLQRPSWPYRSGVRQKNVALWTKASMTGTGIIDQTVGGLSVVILLTLVVFAYGYPYASEDEEDSRHRLEMIQAFWNIFVG